MSNITVAVIFHDANYYSGGTRSMLDIVETWHKDENVRVVAVFPCKGGAYEYTQKLGIPTILCFYTQLRYFVNESTATRLYKLPLRLGGFFVGALNVYTKLNKILRKHGVNIIYSNTGSVFTGAWLQQCMKTPHIWHIREFGEADQGYRILFGERYFKKYLDRCERIIVISHALKEETIKKIKRVAVDVVYDDISQCYINGCVHADRKELKILICGQIIEGKGHLQLLEAMRILQDKGIVVKTYIAGETGGAYYEQLVRYTNNNNLNGSVIFLGQVSDMNELRRHMDIGVVASKTEAFGRVTIEGMLSKMTMIGANCGATPELIQNGKTGLLYEWGNPEDLSLKIEKLYHNRLEMYKLAENGFNDALKYTHGNNAKKIMEIMKELVLQKAE